MRRAAVALCVGTLVGAAAGCGGSGEDPGRGTPPTAGGAGGHAAGDGTDRGGGSANSHGGRTRRRDDLVLTEYGRGPGRVTVIRPADARGRLPALLFLHGWGGTEPRVYGPWVAHLAREGNAVVFPRYQDSVVDLPTQALGNVLVGVREALARGGIDTGPLVVAGHSAGGALAADYAAIARSVGLPEPRAVFSAYPGRSLRGIRFTIPPVDPGRIPAGTRVAVLSGARDAVVDPRDARAIYDGAPQTRRSLTVVRTRGAADHLAPQRATAISRRVFWGRLDALIAAARR